MEVLILGTGCHNCLNLEMMVARLLSELGLHRVPLTRSDDPRQIRQFMPQEALPGLLINGRLVCSGRLLDEAEVRCWLSEAAHLE
jgi:hypothetical protein